MALTKVDARLLTGAIVADDSGNVGLGVTPSAWGENYKVQQIKSGAVAAYQNVQFSIGHNWYDSGIGAHKYINSDYATRLRQQAGEFLFEIAPSGTAGDAITFSEKFRIGQLGQLGLSGANYGTAGQVLTSQGSSAAPVWTDSGAMELLGTITVSPSAPSFSLTNLDLTQYKHLVCAVLNISHNNTASLNFNGVSVSGGTVTTGNNWHGFITNNLFNGKVNEGVNTVAGTGYTNAATSITFSASSGNLTGGTIKVWGVK